MTELARRRPETPVGNGTAPLPALPAGDVIVLRVRRVPRSLVLEIDPIGSAYAEELICAWKLVHEVARETYTGRRNLGGERPK